MSEKRMHIVQGTSLVFGGALFALASSSLVPRLEFISFILSALFFLIGISLTAYLLFPKKKSIKERMAKIKVKNVNKSNLDDLYDLISTYSGGSIIPKERRELIYQRCKKFFIMLKDGNKLDILSKPIGFLVIYPLNKAGVSFLEENNNYAGGLKANHIAKVNSKGCHIAFIWGEDKYSRAKIIQVMDQKIEYLQNKSEGFKVFARPTTLESYKVLKKREYKPRTSERSDLGDVFYKVIV